MIEKNAFKLPTVTLTVSLLFVLNAGMAQTGNDEIRSIYFDNIVRLTVEALNDSCINIALCEVPLDPYFHYEPKVVFDSGDVKRYTASLPPGLLKIKIKDGLRTNVEMDTLIVLSESYIIMREGMYWQFPSVHLRRGSEWIMFLDSPFLMSRWYHAQELQKMVENENRLKNQVILSSKNYFTLYEQDAGALCTYFPEDQKYPPQFIYSEGLVDDFRAIIELQENPSLLSESSDSYENYYNSLKEELGRRVFSRLFESRNQK